MTNSIFWLFPMGALFSPLLINVLKSFDMVWNGLSSVDWSNGGNWNFGFSPGGSDNVTIPDVARQPRLDINTADLANFVTEASGTIDVNGWILRVSGNFTAAVGTITNTTGTIKFDGTTAITSNGNDLKNIEITNGNTLTLQDDLTVNDILNNGTVDCNGFVLTITGTPTGTGSYVGCGGSVAPYSESRKRTTRLPIILGG